MRARALVWLAPLIAACGQKASGRATPWTIELPTAEPAHVSSESPCAAGAHGPPIATVEIEERLDSDPPTLPWKGSSKVVPSSPPPFFHWKLVRKRREIARDGDQFEDVIDHTAKISVCVEHGAPSLVSFRVDIDGTAMSLALHAREHQSLAVTSEGYAAEVTVSWE